MNTRMLIAVAVSTPEHSHAPAAIMGMRRGKHCFCQKPLAHTIYEARRMGEVARENNVITQMGNQGEEISSSGRSLAPLVTVMWRSLVSSVP